MDIPGGDYFYSKDGKCDTHSLIIVNTVVIEGVSLSGTFSFLSSIPFDSSRNCPYR